MKMFKTVFLICACLSAISTKLIIISPPSLKDKFKESEGVVKAVYGNFGKVPYGQYMTGAIWYNASDPYGCTGGSIQDLVEGSEGDAPRVSNFFMFDRGSCSEVMKTRNVARVGGALSIIINNNNQTIDKLFLGDDGSGAGITIPAVMISKRDGDIIKEALSQAKEGTQFIIRVEFEMNRPSGNWVDVRIWYTSSDDRSMDFISDMGEYLKPIIDQLNFNPNVVHFSCKTCDQDFKHQNCISDGKYCALYGHDKGHPDTFNGKQVVEEDLRQICLAQKLDLKARGVEFFDYINRVHESCGTHLTLACSRNIIVGMDFPFEYVQECVEQSYIDNQDNQILKDQMALYEKYGHQVYPSVVINDVTFRGQVNPRNVFQAICAGYRDPPKECKDWYESEGIKEEYTIPIRDEDSDHIGAGTAALIFCVFITSNILIVFLYRKYLQKEIKKDMNLQVNSAVSQYVALSLADVNSSKTDLSTQSTELRNNYQN